MWLNHAESLSLVKVAFGWGNQWKPESGFNCLMPNRFGTWRWNRNILWPASPNVAVTEDEKNQRNWAKLVKFYLFKPFLKMCLNNSNSIVSCVKVWGKYQKSIEKRFWLLKTCNPGILWSGSVQLYKVQWLTVRGWTIQAICEGSNFQTSVHPHNGDLRHGSYHENMISFIAKTIEPILSIDLFGIYWNDLSSLQDPKCPQKNPG